MTAFLLQSKEGSINSPPPSVDWLSANKRIQYRGPDGLRELVVPGARISAANRLVGRRNRDALQPWCRQHGRVIGVFDGRLNAVDGLRRALGLRAHDGELSDVALVVLAYERFGSDFLKVLDGDFALAVFNLESKEIVAARDLMGSRALFWSAEYGDIAISNELPALHALLGARSSLDEIAMSDFLLTGYINYFDKTRTPFAKIHALEPGTRLVVRDGRQRVQPYRRFGDILKTKCPSNPRDVPDAFNAVFSDAMRDRLDADRVLLTLSGGLDSSSIAGHAVKLTRDGRCNPVISAVTQLAHEEDPERRFARSVSTRLDISHEFRVMKAEDVFSFPQAPWFPILQMVGWPRDDPRRAPEKKSQVVIHGTSGDSTLSSERSSWLGLLGNFGLRHAAFALSVSRKQSRLIALGSGVFGRLGLGRTARPFFSFPNQLPAWLSRGLVDELRLVDRWEFYKNWTPDEELHPVHSNAQRWLQWANWYEGPSEVGLDYCPPEWTDPFIDSRVISFCFSLPPEPWMYKKHLLRVAGREMLPSEVLDRPKTPAGHFLGRFNLGDSSLRLQGGGVSPELARFVDASMVEPIDMSVEGRNGYINLRPLMLQRWLLGLGSW